MLASIFLPSLPCLAALSRMFRNTCRSRLGSQGISGISSSFSRYSRVMPSWARRLPYMKMVSSNSLRISVCSTFRVMRPSCSRVKSSSSMTISVSRLASEEMIFRPWAVSAFRLSSASRVSLQPLMTVRGVRSSWESWEINSACIFSFWLILTDISLMVSAKSAISSLYFVLIWAP